MPERFTLGIEEEFQLVDAGTRQLKSHLEILAARLGDQIQPELHASVLEVGSPVCENVRGARLSVQSVHGSRPLQ